MSCHYNAQSAALDLDFRTVNVISDNRSWVVQMKKGESVFKAIREWFPTSGPSFSVYCRPEVFSGLPDEALLNVLSFLDSPRPCVCIYEEFVFEPDSQDDEYEYGCCTYHCESVAAPANVRNPLCLGRVFTPENGVRIIENGVSASSTHLLCEPREVCGFRYARATDDTIATLKAYGERLTEHYEPLTLVIQFHPEYRQGVDKIDVDECFSVVQRLQPRDTKEEDARWAESYEWGD
jgi:hypothetical protein